MNKNNNPQEIDPGLLEKINLLEATPERDPRLAATTREKFLAEVENMPVPASKSFAGWILGIFGFNSLGSRKLAFSTIAAALLVVLILFGGASATAYAAQSALPGDALYSVKTSLEQTQITLANDAYNQAQLHLRFAQRRLDEIKELLAQGRTNDIEFASTEFEHYIQQAMQASQLVQMADPVRGAELNKMVSQALLDYASALKSVLVTVPDPVKPAVQNALMASQDGAGEEVEITGIVGSLSEVEVEIDGVLYSITDLTEFEDAVQVGDLVKIHVIKTEFGAMVISEIELTGLGEDNANFSGNDNSNESFSGNANENESGDDDNENDAGSNENVNENDSDDHGNENGSLSNENDSDDDSNENESNENESDEDKSGSGSSNSGNSNDNSDDDNHNENDSDEDNGNSNNSNSNDNDSEEEHDGKDNSNVGDD